MEVSNAISTQVSASPAKAVYTPDQIAEATANSTPGNVQKGADLTKPLPVFAQYEAKFQSLAATVLNADGKANDDDQMDALVQLHVMGSTGQLFGMGAQSDNAKLLAKASGGSAASQRAEQLYRRMAAAVSPFPDDAVGTLKASLSFYDSLGASDQKALFNTTINPQLETGKNYKDVADWREQTSAHVAFGEYMNEAKASGALTDPSKVSDPKLQQAIKLGSSTKSGRAWTEMVLQLFKQAPKDRVDLSPEAKALLSAKPEPIGQKQNPYIEGSFFKTTA
jgi:hypothetical protein